MSKALKKVDGSILDGFKVPEGIPEQRKFFKELAKVPFGEVALRALEACAEDSSLKSGGRFIVSRQLRSVREGVLL